MEQEQSIFREKAVNRISSADQIPDYLHAPNVKVWVILGAVLLVLAGLFAWSLLGRLEMTAEVRVYVQDGRAQVVAGVSNTIEEGMLLRVEATEAKITGAGTDEFGRPCGVAELPLPDGLYDGILVTGEAAPIALLVGFD